LVYAYHVYRGTLGFGPFLFNHSCFAASLQETVITDPALPSPGQGFYYLVSGRNVCGEGSLGTTSLGDPRPNPQPCP
jgi:hypothetical protein